jgi:hypothetical protein
MVKISTGLYTTMLAHNVQLQGSRYVISWYCITWILGHMSGAPGYSSFELTDMLYKYLTLKHCWIKNPQSNFILL